MKYLLNIGFDPNKRPTELFLLALSKAIRSCVGFSKKVVFCQVREMKNKCLWVLYLVDGVKCSTFVSAATFATLVLKARMDTTTSELHQYFQKISGKHPNCLITNKPEWLELDIKLDDLYRRFYITYHNALDVWEVKTIPSQRFAHKKFQSIHDLIGFIKLNGIKFFA